MALITFIGVKKVFPNINEKVNVSIFPANRASSGVTLNVPSWVSASGWNSLGISTDKLPGCSHGLYR
jgi:hypothetical protein